MATIEPVDIESYDQWRGRLQRRAVESGWNIPLECRGVVMARLVATVEKPETDFDTFTKAVNMLAKLERAEQTAVANAMNVTRWAETKEAWSENDGGILVRLPKPRWPGPYQDELDTLADKMREMGMPFDLVAQVRCFEFPDNEPDTAPRRGPPLALADLRPDDCPPD